MVLHLHRVLGVLHRVLGVLQRVGKPMVPQQMMAASTHLFVARKEKRKRRRI